MLPDLLQNPVVSTICFLLFIILVLATNNFFMRKELSKLRNTPPPKKDPYYVYVPKDLAFFKNKEIPANQPQGITPRQPAVTTWFLLIIVMLYLVHYFMQ